MSKITVTTIAGQTSGADANKVKIESGDTLEVASNSTVGGTLGVTGNTTVGGNITVTGDIIKSTSGTSNFAAGVNAGNSITSGGSNNVLVGDEAGTAITTGESNTFLGASAGETNQTGGSNTYVGRSSGASATGASNTFIGRNAGSQVVNGEKNTFVGRYQGNSGGYDLRTQNNHIVLSDGEGNPAEIIYPSNNANYGNAVAWKSFVKKTGTPSSTANAITLGQSRITLTNNTATNIASGYYGNLVQVFTHAQSAPYNYQYTFLVSSGWNSASVLFSNTYGGNNTTFTFSASSGVMRCHQNSGANIEVTVLALMNSYLPS